ncbi:MAG TPA: site-specific integrase [Terriglobales bacterium]|nr:site-specific integrase [Terriglobales bacterium]
MAIFKRGRIYWYHFIFSGEHIQESTKQGNPRVARQMEAAHRTALAKGEVGIREKKHVPTLATFCRDRLQPYAKARYENASPKTWAWYQFGLKTIAAYGPLSNRKLDEITPEHITGFAAHLQGREWKISSVNSALRALRIAANFAEEWGVISTAPKVVLLDGENHRERVLSHAEEAKYLAAATEPLASVATVLVDTGLRPEECFKLRWEHISFSSGRHGTLRVLEGKTKAARRTLPLTQRVRKVLEARWEAAKKPEDGWIWPAPTKQEHVWHDSIRVQHKNALRGSKIAPFVIYSLRHTFLTRLGLSGCDVWTLARIAGHSSTKMADRYVHPSHEAVIEALERLPQARELAIEAEQKS